VAPFDPRTLATLLRLRGLSAWPVPPELTESLVRSHRRLPIDHEDATAVRDQTTPTLTA